MRYVNSYFHFIDKETSGQRGLVACLYCKRRVHAAVRLWVWTSVHFPSWASLWELLWILLKCHVCWRRSLPPNLVATSEEFTPSSSDQKHVVCRQCFLSVLLFQLQYISCHWFCSRMLAKDELMTILQKCFQVFKSSSEKQLGSTAKRIEEFLAQFQSLDGENIISCQFYWLWESFW